jgi:hypothetical protein
MKANLHAVYRESAAHFGMERLDDALGQSSSANVGLIGRDDQIKTGMLEFSAGFGDFGQNLEFG